jgi:MinD superfamily P-loop ATPase
VRLPREVVIISGKGGTGKTTIAACFAALAESKVLVDADVDAADLFILLKPGVRRQEEFRSGHKAWLDPGLCTQCGQCVELCRAGAISKEFRIDPVGCEGCAVCAHFCPAGAIEMRECVCGQWFVSDTVHGPFVHARLGAGEENSGKLVTLVRHEARIIAEERKLDWIIVDGPPGIGCPVISSVTGASAVLIVTEPTVSGIHDMKRVAELAAHFRVPAAVCINKWDINAEAAEEIALFCQRQGIPLAGRIPYDREVARALVQRGILVEHDPTGRASGEIKLIWDRVRSMAVGSA